MSGDRIFVATSTFSAEGPSPRAALESSGIPFETNPLGRRLKPEDIVQLCAEATGIVAGVEPYTAEVLKQLPQLKVISRVGVGTDAIDKDAAADRGIVIRNTPDVVVQPVAELAIAMIFDLCRHLSSHTAEFRAHRWTKHTGTLVAGKTLGIVGLGRIGRRTAELAGVLGLEVIAADPAPDRAWAEAKGVRLLELESLLAEADIVSLHLAPNADTPFRLDADKIQLMKRGARLINLARGNLIDEAALADALEDGHIAGAGLDVFSSEPYAGPLCDAPNVVLTPHVATLTRESREEMEYQAVRNLVEVLQR